MIRAKSLQGNGQKPNEAVEKVFSLAHSAVKHLGYQASWGHLLRTHRHARYKPIDTSPRCIAIDLERQLLPGTFE